MAITTITKQGAFDASLAKQINDNFASLSASTAGGTLTNTHILVGNGSAVATDVAVSGDATLANTGALTVTGINGTAVAATGTEVNAAAAVIDALPTANVASPGIWNDNGVLKVGTV